jgi:hypothetical protein
LNNLRLSFVHRSIAAGEDLFASMATLESRILSNIRKAQRPRPRS